MNKNIIVASLVLVLSGCVTEPIIKTEYITKYEYVYPKVSPELLQKAKTPDKRIWKEDTPQEEVGRLLIEYDQSLLEANSKLEEISKILQELFRVKNENNKAKN